MTDHRDHLNRLLKKEDFNDDRKDAGGGERIGQCDPQLTVDRVLPLRSIQRQRPHTVAVAAQQHGFLRHQG